VQRGVLRGIDQRAIAWLQSALPPGFAAPLWVLRLFGTAEVVSVLLLCVLVATRRRGSLVLLALYCLIAAIELAGKELLVHPSPPALQYHPVFAIPLPSSLLQTESSYPSGHAARTAFVTTLLCAYALDTFRGMAAPARKAALTGFLVIVNVVMDVSLIYFGSHWTSDVVGGVLLGSGLAMIGFSLGRYWESLSRVTAWRGRRRRPV
jgi:membrane-associated phospholipid phosphatase